MPKYIDGYPDNYSGNDLKADGQWAVGNPAPAPTDTEIVEWLGKTANHFRISTSPGGFFLQDVGEFPTLRLAVIAAMRAEKGSK